MDGTFPYPQYKKKERRTVTAHQSEGNVRTNAKRRSGSLKKKR